MKNKLIVSTLVAASLLISTGCTHNYVNINTDPIHPTAGNFDYSTLLTSAELISAGNSDANDYEAWRGNLIYSECLIQHLSSVVGYWAGDKYSLNSSYASALWDETYGPQHPIQNIVSVITNTKGNAAKTNLYNVARIFRVWIFQRITDLYGDCPYFQAGLGYDSSITSPVYDKQSVIYPDMLNELQDAASKLDASADQIGAGDILYQGDVTKWKKFAYSEMARIAMRLVKVDPTNAQKWVAAAVAGGTFTSSDDNAIIHNESAAPNGAGAQVGNGSGGVLIYNDPAAAHVSKTMVDLLKSTNDPRLTFIATTLVDPTVKTALGDTVAAHQIGMPNGYDLTAGGAFDLATAPGYNAALGQYTYSYVNRYTFARLDAPTFFLTYGETELILADAATRGWVTDVPAATHYANGVTGSMQQLVQAGAGPSDALITAYLTANPYDAANGIEQANTQYYISTFMDGYEAWNNWKASGFPVLTPVPAYPGNATGGTIPRRLTYPTTEPGVNPANYSAAVLDLDNGDKLTSRVWWDKP